MQMSTRETGRRRPLSPRASRATRIGMVLCAVLVLALAPRAAAACPEACGSSDGVVGVDDLLELLSQWGGPGPCDVTGEGAVGVDDLLLLLAAWGPCPAADEGCIDNCGVMAPAGCWCDAACLQFDDCCADACSVCGQCADPNNPSSCDGHCGAQSPGGCWCDSQCVQFGDCCGDACTQCGHCDGGGDCAPPACNKINVECLSGPEYDNRTFVGRMLFNGNAHCTAWIIAAPDLVMTNAHCIVGGAAPSAYTVLFNDECSSCTGGVSQPVSALAATQIIAVNNGLDYAILRLEGNPAAEWGQATIDASPLAVGTPIYEIHHAQGRKKGYDEGNVTALNQSACISGQVAVNVVADGGASGSPIFRSANHCVAAICNCGPSCGPGFGVPMSSIWPQAQSQIAAAGGTVLMCGDDPDPPVDPDSCKGFCDEQAPGGCWCDAQCLDFGDCCDDACAVCGHCECIPDCAGAECGPDGCGGSCGSCPAGFSCSGGACVPDNPDSCVGFCDEQAPGGCWCDAQCLDFGDCCDDACAVCGHCACIPDCAGVECGPDGCGGSCGSCPAGFSCSGGACVPDNPDSCIGFCDEQAPGGCWCDELCLQFGDCCDDACAVCGQCADPNSCVGSCGEQAPGGCWCDELCCDFNDCCADKQAVCGGCSP